MKSWLLPYDGLLQFSDIIQKPLPKAGFTFLSACQTTKWDQRRPEATIHIHSTGRDVPSWILWRSRHGRYEITTLLSLWIVFTSNFSNMENQIAQTQRGDCRPLRERPGGRPFVPFIRIGVLIRNLIHSVRIGYQASRWSIDHVWKRYPLDICVNMYLLGYEYYLTYTSPCLPLLGE